MGKAKRGSPEEDLYKKFIARCRFDVQLHELPETGKASEGEAILKRLPAAVFLICMDERGKDLTSPEFAAALETAHLDQRPIALVIGGPDGLDAPIRQRADVCLRFGRLVWPHLLIRGMLAEQIYRAQTILDGHPYHRL